MPKLELISGTYSTVDFDEEDLQSLLDAYFSENETMPVFQRKHFPYYRPGCEENKKYLIGTVTKDQFNYDPNRHFKWGILMDRKSDYGEASLVFKNCDDPKEGLFGINFVDKLALWL